MIVTASTFQLAAHRIKMRGEYYSKCVKKINLNYKLLNGIDALLNGKYQIPPPTPSPLYN